MIGLVCAGALPRVDHPASYFPTRWIGWELLVSVESFEKEIDPPSVFPFSLT
jgi:hypothetical protein